MPSTITGYECTRHNFTTKSKMALQLHTDVNTGCNLMPIREDFTPPPPAPKPEPAEPPHLGPHWEHDCDACVYLGSTPHCDRQYDLYWCPPNKFQEEGNLIARHGIMGDYVSGMNWVLREPILAVAAVRAMREGHLAASVLRDRRMY